MDDRIPQQPCSCIQNDVACGAPFPTSGAASRQDIEEPHYPLAVHSSQIIPQARFLNHSVTPLTSNSRLFDTLSARFVTTPPVGSRIAGLMCRACCARQLVQSLTLLLLRLQHTLHTYYKQNACISRICAGQPHICKVGCFASQKGCLNGGSQERSERCYERRRPARISLHDHGIENCKPCRRDGGEHDFCRT